MRDTGRETVNNREYSRRQIACLLVTVMVFLLIQAAVPGPWRTQSEGAGDRVADAGNVNAAAGTDAATGTDIATGADAAAGKDDAPGVIGESADSGIGWTAGEDPDEGELLENDLSYEQAYALATASNLEFATLSNLPRSAGTGDLWRDWNGDMDFSGSGTKDYPYQIDGLAKLMGLAEAVAGGEDFAGEYFEMTCDIHLENLETNSGSWNPIGWYQNQVEMAGDIAHPFRGHFDGGGNTITGLKIINPSLNMKNIGLFGQIDDGTVKNLNIEADDIHGAENAAVLAGIISGSTIIYNVNVSGYVYSSEDAGGIAAEVIGSSNPENNYDTVIIENCRADGIILNSAGSGSCVGGIAGNVQRACLADNTVLTQNGDANRIQGKGYVGGIVGRMRETCVYNSYVNGTIGGNGSAAAGGIAGKYESGCLILARMAGDISRTNNGSASREGTFVGTRESRHNFTYGTEKDSKLAYLYTNSAAKAKNVFGSNIDGDNSFTKSAHIGYWSDLERRYATVAGKTEEGCGERYFYEELEDGVRYIVTQKLGREFTADSYADGLSFRMDHFAPGYMGQPVRGYLVSVRRIDARNANGTFDTDVASLTAISETGSSYYRAIDKDSAAAIAPGAVVTVTTAPKNTAEHRYQMVVNTSENGGVKPPTYRDESHETVPMNYTAGGSYSFIMPECDTELSAEYVKVTTKLTIDPAETLIHIIQTRSGDRKRPGIVTEVKNADGILTARYIDGEQDRSVEVQPLTIHAEHNGAGQTVDRTVRWIADDLNLLVNQSDNGYTERDAAILPNLDSSFIQDIINREVEAQADNQYREKINNTVYTKYAVVTAVTNPETSVNNQPVYGNCRIGVTFQIIDNTTVRVEGLSLNKNSLEFTVTRRLTGNRSNPSESITCTAPAVLTASLTPQQPFLKNVGWSDGESGKIITLEPAGVNMRDCRVSVNYDASGQENPAWIQNIINADREKKKASPQEKVEGAGMCRETILAVSEDQTHGNVAAVCDVTIRFITIDDTIKTSGGSSGSGGGGGGGGSSSGSRGVTTTGSVTAAGPSLPEYVVTGTWIQNAAGRWIFTDEARTYANEWAAVHNPYADASAGQSAYDWFRFDADGYLLTGWYADTDGNRYYLHTASDGTLGRMYTGWNWIEGKCYYFNEDSDGTRGSLKCNFTAPDGRTTNGDGVWVTDGIEP